MARVAGLVKFGSKVFRPGAVSGINRFQYLSGNFDELGRSHHPGIVIHRTTVNHQQVAYFREMS